MIRAPLHLVGNRPLVDLDIEGPTGSASGRFLVDTGGSGLFLVSDDIAERSGLTFAPQEGIQTRVAHPPRARLAGAELDLDGLLAAPLGSLGHNIDGLIGARLLARYHVTLDYLAGTIELAPEGQGARGGVRIDAPMSPGAWFPRIELQVDGATYGFLLDTGASYTMVSEAVLAAWSSANPSWPRHIGARDDAAMGVNGEEALTMLVIPTLQWGPLTFSDVGVVGRAAGTFEEWMSQWMPAPIVGALGTNVLRELRVEIDYVEQAVFVEHPR